MVIDIMFRDGGTLEIQGEGDVLCYLVMEMLDMLKR
jgi:hypothetical protein